ncbi:hypothetical protein [Labrenzia phage vB_LagS-V1]
MKSFKRCYEGRAARFRPFVFLEYPMRDFRLLFSAICLTVADLCDILTVKE